MPRKLWFFLPDVPAHIVQRGRNSSQMALTPLSLIKGVTGAHKVEEFFAPKRPEFPPQTPPAITQPK